MLANIEHNESFFPQKSRIKVGVSGDSAAVQLEAEYSPARFVFNIILPGLTECDADTKYRIYNLI